jgi:hypothetical protein
MQIDFTLHSYKKLVRFAGMPGSVNIARLTALTAPEAFRKPNITR